VHWRKIQITPDADRKALGILNGLIRGLRRIDGSGLSNFREGVWWRGHLNGPAPIFLSQTPMMMCDATLPLLGPHGIGEVMFHCCRFNSFWRAGIVCCGDLVAY
jgi:hypothetical protein